RSMKKWENFMQMGAGEAESQRDSATKPRVARNELPWDNDVGDSNPERVAADEAGVHPALGITDTPARRTVAQIGESMPLGIATRDPGGIADNSPTFQRWELDPQWVQVP